MNGESVRTLNIRESAGLPGPESHPRVTMFDPEQNTFVNRSGFRREPCRND